MDQLSRQEEARIGQMNAQLAAVVAELERSQARLHSLQTSLGADRVTVRNDPARWSVAECIAHLNITGRAFIPLPQFGTRGRMLGATRTPSAFEPARDVTSMAVTDLIAEFDRLQTDLVSIIVEGNGLSLDRVRIASPFDARVR